MTGSFSVTRLLAKKRDGLELTKGEIEFLVQQITSGDLQDSQLGAFLMAVYLKSMNLPETIHLTRAMVNSGDTLQLPSSWRGRMVDKHSTGGVGDKISLPLAPALAACDLKVPMISGRGLGHTGGTLDKLESIPGFNVYFSPEEMESILDEVGCCIVGQTTSLVPADRIMYAARDVTGTVESLPLIASSIVSKKVAENLDALVLDVKAGSGSTVDDSKVLAEWMVGICAGNGIKTNAVITQMDDPIGMKIGNSLEIIETIECLRGKGPSDVLELVSVLGGHLLSLVGKAENEHIGAQKIRDAICSGKAMEKFRAMLKAQGVDPSTADKLCDFNDVASILRPAKFVTSLKSKENGFIHAIDCMPLARVSCELGAGRKKAGESVNHAVGLELELHVGSQVKKGEVWIRAHHDDPQLSSDHINQVQEALVVKTEKCDAKSRIIEVVKGSKAL